MKPDELTKRIHDLRCAQEIFIRQGDVKSAMIMTFSLQDAEAERSRQARSNRRTRFLQDRDFKRYSNEPTRY
jgi:hypothetical protein